MTHATPRANTARNTPTKSTQSAEAACKALFGRYPEDVLSRWKPQAERLAGFGNCCWLSSKRRAR